MYFWTFQWEEIFLCSFEHSNPEEKSMWGRYVVVEAQDANKNVLWSVQLDATDGSDDLMPRSWIETHPSKEKPFLIVGTVGEHYRGASLHNEKLWFLSKAGELSRYNYTPHRQVL